MKKLIKRYPRDVADWWQKTQDDLLWAESTFKNGFYVQVCFLAQQIIEKALKTFLLAQNLPVQKTHNLIILLNKTRKIDDRFQEFKSACELIDKYYMAFRYPTFGGEWGSYSKKEAKEALSKAKEITDYIKKRLVAQEAI